MGSITVCFNNFQGNRALHFPYLLLLHPVMGWNFSCIFFELPQSLLYFVSYYFDPPLHVCMFDLSNMSSTVLQKFIRHSFKSLQLMHDPHLNMFLHFEGGGTGSDSVGLM